MNTGEDDFLEKRTLAHGLAFACPMPPQLPTCSFREIRKLPEEERFDVVNNMTEQQINVLIDTHKKCLRRREAYFREGSGHLSKGA